MQDFIPSYRTTSFNKNESEKPCRPIAGYNAPRPRDVHALVGCVIVSLTTAQWCRNAVEVDRECDYDPIRQWMIKLIVLLRLGRL